MNAAAIPVDLLNPGQVFACIGFVEAAVVLLGDARGGFNWGENGGARFRIEAASEDPVARVLRFLDEAKVKSYAPADSELGTEKPWRVDTERAPQDSREYPVPQPKSPEKLPARIRDTDGNIIAIDHWGDQGQRDNVKFWAGAGGLPGAARVRDTLKIIDGRAADHSDDPFALTAMQTNSFGFDWRGDYVPLDAGFAPNKHKQRLTIQGYPIVELLAAIGLTHARPRRHDKLRYSYGVAGTINSALYDPVFLRVALGSPSPPLPTMPFRRFAMRLAEPAKEGTMRCIAEVIEENTRS